MRRTLNITAVKRRILLPLVFARRAAGTASQQNSAVSSSADTSANQTLLPAKTYKEPLGLEIPLNREELQRNLTFRDSTVREILEGKGNLPLAYCLEEETVQEAIQRMSSESVSALVVVRPDDHGKLQMTGIFTERDYMKVSMQGRAGPTSKIKDVMSINPIHVSLDDRVADCMEIIIEKKFRHLPVCEYSPGRNNGICYPVGYISIGDLVKYVISEQKQTIEFLNDYIQRAGYE